MSEMIPCPCTAYEQDESCPVGYPSQLCWACGGIGRTTIDKVVALAAEMMRIADEAGETSDPFAAWESLRLLDAHTAEQPAPAKRRAREQMTLCDDCGKELPHDAAVWTNDGASYCPKCRPQIAAAPVMDQPAPDAVAEAPYICRTCRRTNPNWVLCNRPDCADGR